jgi:hypothetical protein
MDGWMDGWMDGLFGWESRGSVGAGKDDLRVAEPKTVKQSLWSWLAKGGESVGGKLPRTAVRMPNTSITQRRV